MPRSVSESPALVRVAARTAAADVRGRRRLLRTAVGWISIGAWRPVRAYDGEAMLRAAEKRGPLAQAGATALRLLLASLAGRDDAGKLIQVNQFFNRRIAFATDQEVWGVEDYWASPLEMMQKGRGDCEDYVIGKYFSLLAAGIAPGRLRLVYVRATVQGKVLAHMVLAYYATPLADPLILDNLVGDIRPASDRSDLAPVFSFNAEGLWQGTGSQSAGDPVARLSRWRDVIAKARADGF